LITGDLESRIDAVWNDFWSGGISNPPEVMEQLTYLLFIKGLDEQQTLKENKANLLGAHANHKHGLAARPVPAGVRVDAENTFGRADVPGETTPVC
jgi:hypothetical protein